MNEINPTPPKPHYHCSDAYHRANAKGTGSAIKFELHPAHDDVAGSVFVKMAPQLTLASRQGNEQTFATFDWKNGITLKLDRTDLSQILQVLRGMQESVGENDRGLFHTSSQGSAIIWFKHLIDPNPGYMLSVSKTYTSGEQRKCYYFFDVGEALALSISLEQAMMYVCFGIPEVIPRFDKPTIAPAAATPVMPQFIPRNAAPAVSANISRNPTPIASANTVPGEYRAVSGDPF